MRILDHGSIELVEAWGSDATVIASARMSTGGAFKGWGEDGGPPGDEKLLRYLWEHKHATPFEMCGMTIEVQAPIFVVREWMRHRTQSFSEASARYAPMPDLNYIPTLDRLLGAPGTTSKQAGAVKGAAALDEEGAETFRRRLEEHYTATEALYQASLAAGVSKELARIHLPVGRYTRMRVSANLRNWLGFLTLRLAPDVQFEIRQYARVVGALIEDIFPRTWELFAESLQEKT